MNTEDSDRVDPRALEYDAGLTPLDIWYRLVRQKLWVIGIAAASIIGALCYVFIVPPQWEAVGTLQIGKLGGRDSNPLIELPSRTLARMKLTPFAHDVLAGLGIDPNSREATLYQESLNLKVLPNTDLLELKVRAYSREQAGLWANATVAHISEVHEVLAQPAKQRLVASLDEVNRDLGKVESERAQLLESMPIKQQTGRGIQFAERVLIANMISTAERHLRDLHAQKRSLEEQVSPVKTFPTSLIDRIYVPDQPAFPKRPLIIGVAGVIGLLLGSFAALGAEALRRSRLKPIAPAQMPARGERQV